MRRHPVSVAGIPKGVVSNRNVEPREPELENR